MRMCLCVCVCVCVLHVCVEQRMLTAFLQAVLDNQILSRCVVVSVWLCVLVYASKRATNLQQTATDCNTV